jgi:hypothetical protein
METFWTVVIVVVAFFFCTMAVFMVMEKKVVEDYRYLEAYVSRCEKNQANLGYCLEELARLRDTGLLPKKEDDDMMARIRLKFR